MWSKLKSELLKDNLFESQLKQESETKTTLPSISSLATWPTLPWLGHPNQELGTQAQVLASAASPAH